MFWSLVRPDRISPLRCEVRIVGDEKKAIVDALNAPMDEARLRMTRIPKGASSTRYPGGAWLPEMAQAKRAAEDMLERMRRES